MEEWLGGSWERYSWLLLAAEVVRIRLITS